MHKTAWLSTYNRRTSNPRLITGINDVAILVQGIEEKHPKAPTTVINVDPEVVPRYLTPVTTDGMKYVYFFLEPEGELFQYSVSTRNISKFATISASHDFDMDFSIFNDGVLIAACSLFFHVIDHYGQSVEACNHRECVLPFQRPIGRPPFWELPLNLPSSVSSFDDTFVIGGSPASAIFKYSLSGALIASIYDFKTSHRRFNLEEEVVCYIRCDSQGNIWVSTLEHLFVYSQTGEPIRYWKKRELLLGGARLSPDGWFGIDRNGLVWLYGEQSGDEASFGALALEM